MLVVGNGPEIKPAWMSCGMGAVHPIDITIPQPKQEPVGAGEQAVSKKQSRQSGAGRTKLAVVIMAAGKGTRLKSRRPKVLHQVGGRPIAEPCDRCG